MASNPRPLLLIVDDDERSARMLAQLLREDGFDVEVVLDGAGAVARLSERPLPDALLTDVRMPNVDGVTVARVARALCATMPVFFLTGYPELTDGDRHLAAPEPIVLTKPLSYPDLSSALARPFPDVTPSPLDHGASR